MVISVITVIKKNRIMKQKTNLIHYCKHCKTKVTPWIQLRRRHPKKNGLVLCVYCLDCGRTIKRNPNLKLYIQWINSVLSVELDNYFSFKKLTDFPEKQP